MNLSTFGTERSHNIGSLSNFLDRLQIGVLHEQIQTIYHFRHIKIQLGGEAKRTQTKEMNKQIIQVPYFISKTVDY